MIAITMRMPNNWMPIGHDPGIDVMNAIPIS
jgi:hypothetical protein